MSTMPQQWLQRHGLSALIGGLAVGLLGVIGYETQWGSSLRPVPAIAVVQAAKGSDTSLLPAFELPPVDVAFKETAEHPLFLPLRRPVPLVTGAAQPLMKKGQFRLAGTVVNQEMPYAFLVEISTGKGLRVARGSEIVSTGISVSVVDAARVVLKQGDETEELSLRTSSSPPAPIVAAPGMPGAQIPGVAQRPPPSGVVVGGIPTMPGVAANVPVPAAAPGPGMAVPPGFVQAAPGTATNPAQVNPADAAAAQRRRRFPTAPQQ